MRSGTSFFDWTVYKKTIARFWPLWTVYSVLWLIELPLQGLIMLRLDADTALRSDGTYMETFARSVVLNNASNLWAIPVVFGVLAAMAVFSHLYNARSANLFGSLPIRREGLFLTHYLAGLSFMIVPNVVIFLLTLLVEGLGGYVELRGLLFWLGNACGGCLFFYSLAVFCGMFTGHILALPAFYAIFNMLAYGVTGLVYLVLNGFYYGFAGYSSTVNHVVELLTPVMCLSHNVGYYWWDETLVIQNMEVVAGYALAGLALAAGAFFLYRARHLESAGDVVSVKPMRPVFKYGVAFCAGMLFGEGTAYVMGGGEFTMMAAILIWGVAGYFAAQMMLDKSFRVFKKWKGAAAVAGVFAALFLVVAFDLTGFETRVPKAADVKSVYVNGLSTVNFADNGDRAYVDIEDPAQIELLTILHQAAVDQRGEKGYDRELSTGLTLKYTLNNGSTLSRQYVVWLDPAEVDQEGTAAWAVEQLYQDRDLYWQVYGFKDIEAVIAEGGRLDNVMFCHYEEYKGGVGDVLGYGADARAVLDAVEEDFLAGRIGVRSLTDRRAVTGGEPMDQLEFRVMDPKSGDKLYEVDIALQDTAASTLAELKRLEANMDNESIRGAFETWLK